jgi:hypothetical protein
MRGLRELLATVKMVEHFHRYFHGQEFHLGINPPPWPGKTDGPLGPTFQRVVLHLNIASGGSTSTQICYLESPAPGHGLTARKWNDSDRAWRYELLLLLQQMTITAKGWLSSCLPEDRAARSWWADLIGWIGWRCSLLGDKLCLDNAKNPATSLVIGGVGIMCVFMWMELFLGNCVCWAYDVACQVRHVCWSVACVPTVW